MVRGSQSPIHEHIDRSCGLLANAHRRRVLYVLGRRGSATVGELADAVVSAGLANARKRALTSLVHVHLPKLDDFDAVDYDGPDGVVSLSDGVERLEPFLTVAARRETDRDQLSDDSGLTPEVVVSTE